MGGGERVWRRGNNYTYRYTVTTRMTPALRWPAMRVILMFHKLLRWTKITRQCLQTTIFEVKEEPKRIRTDVPLRLTSLTRLTVRPNRRTEMYVLY